MTMPRKPRAVESELETVHCSCCDWSVPFETPWLPPFVAVCVTAVESVVAVEWSTVFWSSVVFDCPFDHPSVVVFVREPPVWCASEPLRSYLPPPSTPTPKSLKLTPTLPPPTQPLVCVSD